MPPIESCDRSQPADRSSGATEIDPASNMHRPHAAISPAAENRPQDPAPDYDLLPTAAGYDRWSAVYDEEENPLVRLEEREVLSALGEVRGLTIADIGCGTGRHALRLARNGAQVTAVDFSDGMLAKARSKPGADSVRFLAHDLARPLPFDDASFDRVLCCLVLDHIHDLPGLFRELRRILAPGGLIVASTVHPAMNLRGVTARFTDPQTGRETRPASALHQISDYVMAVVRSDLAIARISEHAPDDALVAQCERARKYLGWPMLLMMTLTRGTSA